MTTKMRFEQLGNFIEQNSILKNEMVGFDINFSFNKAFAESLELFQKYDTPLNIRCHSVMVALATLFLMGFSSDKEKLLNDIKTEAGRFSHKTVQDATTSVIRAAMLHDIGKIDEIISRKQGKIIWHSVTGGQILRSHGLVWEGEICEKHTTEHFAKEVLSEAAKLVNCADKLVNHHTLVPLSERFIYLKRAYDINESIKKDYETYLQSFNIHHMYAEFQFANKALDPFYVNLEK